MRDVAAPYAEKHGIELVVLNKRDRDGNVVTLYGKLTKPGSQSTSIPYRSYADGPPMSRSCTAEFKIRVVGRELHRRGARAPKPCKAHRAEQLDLARAADKKPTYVDVAGCSDCTPPNRAVIGIGISQDEAQRANTRRSEPHEQLVYPLIGLGEETGLRLRRDDCSRIIREAGLPVPPKSSCWFCPHHKTGVWADMRRTDPEKFERAADLEQHLHERNMAAGKGPVFISRAGIPLRQAIDDGQVSMFEAGDDGCDSGWCFT